MPLYFKPLFILKPGMQEEGKYYAKELNFGIIDTNRIAENVAKRSGHSVGQVVGFFQDYFRRIEEYVVSGNNVSLTPIGTIIPAFRCMGVPTEKEVELKNLKNIHLNFRPSGIMRKRMQPKGKYSSGEVELKIWKVNSKE